MNVTPYNFDLSPDNLEANTKPNKTTSYQVTLTNTGKLPDSYTLALSGATWTSQLAAITVGPLAAGAFTTVTVNVTAPNELEGSDKVTLLVTSQNINALVQEVSLTTTIIPNKVSYR